MDTQIVKKGPVTLENGTIYEGEWKGEEKHGFGEQKWAPVNGEENGDCYKGEWENGKMHGQGKITFGNGDYY